jgi:hypothetical protein
MDTHFHFFSCSPCRGESPAASWILYILVTKIVSHSDFDFYLMDLKIIFEKIFKYNQILWEILNFEKNT